MTPRRPLPEELEPLTALWERRWHEAHAAIVPPGLTAARTRADFAARMREFAGDLWVIGPEGAPQGFVALKGHHIDQLYIDAALQGTGAARLLLTHGEQMLAGRGHAQAELWCATGSCQVTRV
jgi:GNAT superfamily N-acetyltransferase